MRAWQFGRVAILCLIASAACAQTIDVYDGQGGLLSSYQMQWPRLLPRGKVPNHWPLRISMHRTRWLYSAPKHLRHAECTSRVPLGHYRVPHAGAVERLSAGYSPVDQPAWRSHLSNALATSSKHLPLLSQMLSWKSRQRHDCPENYHSKLPSQTTAFGLLGTSAGSLGKMLHHLREQAEGDSDRPAQFKTRPCLQSYIA